jgi:hypothetical protein
LIDIAQVMEAEGIVESIHPSTLSRWFAQDALRPWRYHSWLFSRDPHFVEKASRVLDLYHGIWQGEPLRPDDAVLSADEKSGLQVLRRQAPVRLPQSNQQGQVEFEYERLGTLSYQAVLDVQQGIVMDRVCDTNCIDTFNQLLHQVMQQPQYAQANRVFWIVDNGGCHHPATFPDRLSQMYDHAIAVHLPVHASWLNQIELYFSILQRKALTPCHFIFADQMDDRLIGFRKRFNQNPQPFNWQYTADDLRQRMQDSG